MSYKNISTISTSTTSLQTRGLAGIGRWAALLLTATLGLALTGCGADAPEAPGEPSSPGGSDPGNESTPNATDPDADPSVDAFGSPAECLVGAWTADNESFLELIASTMQQGQIVADSTGSVVLTFTEDGATSTEYQDWSFTMEQDGQAFTVLRNGIDRGTYGVDGAKLTLTETESNSTIEMFVGSTSYGAQSRPEGETLSSGEFTCTARTLSVVSEGGATEFSRS